MLSRTALGEEGDFSSQEIRNKNALKRIAQTKELIIIPSPVHLQEVNELVYSNVPGPTKCYWIGISDIEHEDK